MLIESLRYMSANCTVEVSEAGGTGRRGGGGDVGEHIKLVFSLNIRASLGVIVCERALHLGERSEPRECYSRERATKPREAISPPFPAVASLLACHSRVYFFRNPPNGELTRRLWGLRERRLDSAEGCGEGGR